MAKDKKTRNRGNGEGTIFKRTIRGKEKWVAEYTLGYDKAGKRLFKSLYGDTRAEVKDKLDKLITELGTDTYVQKSGIILKDLTLQIIEDEYRLNRLKDISYLRKLATLEHIKKHYIADLELQKITERDVKNFLASITSKSNSLISKAYGMLNNTFNRAVRKKIMKYNFLDDKLECGKPKSIKQDKKVKGFPIDDHRKLLDSIETEFATLQKNQMIQYKYQMLLSLFTGMRMGEINALDKDIDIDFKEKKIRIRRTTTRDKNELTILGVDAKTDAGERILDMNMDDQIEILLKDYIDNYWQPNSLNLLFWDTRKDKIFTTSQVNGVFKRLCEKYDINKGYDVNQHQLRHTFATRNIEAGMPANVLQDIMGHTDLKTTVEVYCDVFAEYKKVHTDNTQNYYIQKDLLYYKKEVMESKSKDISKTSIDNFIGLIMDMWKNNDTRLYDILNTELSS